ncbi:MAG TPA: carboxypeptidase-like regulatory domain-containing protein, partial [Pyrinomonadaceae bacterium]|nr:carboxypeptidase-like regulatory domain-containing protein [Pyrinomonadaceae bacterium]
MDAELSARMATVLLKLVAVILFCTAVVYPQSERLIVRGEIRDQHEDLIVGARVSLTDPNKLSREVISDVNGAFRFGGLEPGRYELSIVAVGFSGHVETFSMRPD